MCKIFSKLITFIVVSMFLSVNLLADNSTPPVKKSNTGICHPKGGTYYGQTKNFVSYQSMDECVKSGGRPPKR